MLDDLAGRPARSSREAAREAPRPCALSSISTWCTPTPSWTHAW